MMKMYIQSPVGILEIEIEDKSVHTLKLSNKKLDQISSKLLLNPDEGLRMKKGENAENGISKQLKDFFAGKLSRFDILVNAKGTDFQKAVWSATASIPFGETRTYGEIATMIGKPNAARAVGQALTNNPICIVVPCHRVVGARNSGGYAYGKKMKKWLLEHENKHLRSL